MRIFGLEISIKKAVAALLQPISGNGGWWPLIRESFTGAWQQNVEVSQDTVLAYPAVYACTTLIASDIGKLRIKLVEEDDNGVSSEVTRNSPFLPLLRRPNTYQNRIQFVQQWMLSKLIHGNTYALKVRDNRGIVTRLYILNPLRVKVLVAPDGSVWYELQQDMLSLVPESEPVTVPASEMIHDTMECLFHPLVGISPLYAAGLAATQGFNIQTHSAKFFKNQSRPSGVLTAPGSISDETAARLKAAWDTNFGGENSGKTAVLGDGLKYEAMSMSAEASQLIDQLKITAEMVCSCYHVPGYKVGVGAMPPASNIEALDQQYYSQCLQKLIESFELSVGEGISLPTNYYIELDLAGLLRMDTAAQYRTLAEGVKGSIIAPNEARLKLNLPPVPGGDSPMAQQQNYSLEALAKRDALADPFATGGQTASSPAPMDEPPDPQGDTSKALTHNAGAITAAQLEKAMALTLEMVAPIHIPSGA